MKMSKEQFERDVKDTEEIVKQVLSRYSGELSKQEAYDCLKAMLEANPMLKKGVELFAKSNGLDI